MISIRSSLASAGLMLALVAPLAAADATFTGTSPVMAPELRAHVRIALAGAVDGYSSNGQALSALLETERHTQTVDQAMAVKRSGLTLVHSLEDFMILASSAFSNPSDSYRAALSQFIAQNVTSAVVPGDSIERLLVLEARTTTVDHARAVKTAGLRLVRDLRDFEVLSRRAFSNPSDSYVATTSEFISRNVGVACHPGADLTALLTIEARTGQVDQAMAVKTAGLAAVSRFDDFEVLSRRAFSNPSDSYLASLSAWIARNAGRAGIGPDTDISRILVVEARTTQVDDAMSVKRAGLAAVRSQEQFLQLSRPAFSNPSASYSNALGQFVATYAGQFLGGGNVGPSL